MIQSSDAYSILQIFDNVFLSKDGSVSINFLVKNPEPYSLDEKNLDLRHISTIKAFKNIINDVFIQLKNVVLEDKYNSERHYYNSSFISDAESKHFNGRDSIINYTLLSFTLTELKSLNKSYIANPLKYSENLTSADKDSLNAFFESVKSSVGLLNGMYNTFITPIDEEDLKQVFFDEVNGFHRDGSLRDIVFGSKLEIGENMFSVFSISDNSYLPDIVSNVVDENHLNRKNVSLKTGLMDDFGVFFPKNHIYNQIIHFKGHERLKEEFNRRVENYEKHQSFSPSIKNEFIRINDIYQDALERNHTLCKAHFNIITWDSDSGLLKKKEDKIKEILNRKEIKFYIPSYEGLSNIFLGSIIGRQKKLSPDYFFLSTLETSSCLFTNYSFYEDDSEGIIFQDRLLQTPIRKDWWDERKKRVNARNFLIFAPTGSGKSSATLNLVQQFLEDGIKIVIAEFGASFEQLSKLYPKRSAHIKFTIDTPLGINPFDLDGNDLSNDKLSGLTEIVLKFWRRSIEDRANPTINVSVTKIIQDYYKNIIQGHSFQSFYDYVITNYNEIIKRNDIEESYFDIKSFKLVCSQFLAGGKYENVCKGNEQTENILKGKDLVVFELRGIKGDKFLVSLVLSLLNDTVQEKILSDKSKKGYLIFDEMAESQELQDSYSGDDILSTVAFLYQGIRKENGGVGCIYQTPTQLPTNNHFAESIIGNTQILGVLQGNEQVYDNIIDRFHIKNQEHIDLMKSVQNDFTADKPHSEMFIRFNEQYAIVVRLEFSKEKYYAFQTEGAEWSKIQEDYSKSGSMEESITNIIKLNQ